MNLEIPEDCQITAKANLELRKQVKYLIENYEKITNDGYKIYLCSNCLNILRHKKKYWLTIVEYQDELFWYLKPFYNSYLLVKKTEEKCLDILLLIIKILN